MSRYGLQHLARQPFLRWIKLYLVGQYLLDRTAHPQWFCRITPNNTVGGYGPPHHRSRPDHRSAPHFDSFKNDRSGADPIVSLEHHVQIVPSPLLLLADFPHEFAQEPGVM